MSAKWPHHTEIEIRGLSDDLAPTWRRARIIDPPGASPYPVAGFYLVEYLDTGRRFGSHESGFRIPPDTTKTAAGKNQS